MKVAIALPPGHDLIVKAFPKAATTHGVMYCWGDTIYNPDNVTIPESLMAHEQVHSEQQAKLPGGAEEWWARYIVDPAFRLAQEAPAHATELLVVTKGWRTNRKHRLYCMSYIAHRLSSSLYGKMLSLQQAEAGLRHAMKQGIPA